MAQEQNRQKRRLRMLAARYGIRANRGVALACAILVVLVGAVGILRVTATPTALIERTNESAASSVIATQSGSKNEMNADESSGKANANKSETTPTEVWVHVDGAVLTPGVYAVSTAKPRVKDAIDLAGGLASDADTTAINLAEQLADGQKIYIPHQGEAPVASPQAAETPAGNPVEASGQTSSGLININSATEAELLTLPGVGEATAAAIVEERNNGGPFSAPEDIMRVSGIGEKKYEKMKEHICV